MPPPTDAEERFFELGLHLLPGESADIVRTAFAAYAAKLGFSVHQKNTFQAGNLWFAPVEGNPEALTELAKFTMVRVLRPMPRLRNIRPLQRSSGVAVDFELPSEEALSPNVRVAIIDGGLPDAHSIAPWVRKYVHLERRQTIIRRGRNMDWESVRRSYLAPYPPMGRRSVRSLLLTIFELWTAWPRRKIHCFSTERLVSSRRSSSPDNTRSST